MPLSSSAVTARGTARSRAHRFRDSALGESSLRSLCAGSICRRIARSSRCDAGTDRPGVAFMSQRSLSIPLASARTTRSSLLARFEPRARRPPTAVYCSYGYSRGRTRTVRKGPGCTKARYLTGSVPVGAPGFVVVTSVGEAHGRTRDLLPSSRRRDIEQAQPAKHPCRIYALACAQGRLFLRAFGWVVPTHSSRQWWALALTLEL